LFLCGIDAVLAARRDYAGFCYKKTATFDSRLRMKITANFLNSRKSNKPTLSLQYRRQ
jgi:hypothetical protein